MFKMLPKLNVDNNILTPEQIYILDTHGIIFIKNFLSTELVLYINTIIDNHLLKISPRPSKFSFFTLDAIFAEIMAHPWIMNACQFTMGDQFRLDHVVGIEQPGMIQSAKTGDWVEQGYKYGNIHGGIHCSHGSCFYHSQDNKIWIGQVAFGICLSGQTKNTGGFCYIPGSHKQANSANGAKIFNDILKQDFSSSCIVLPNMDAGDAVFFSESLMHGTTPIQKETKRRAIYYKYLPGYAVWRSYDEIKHYINYAKTDLQKKLLRAPYVVNIHDDDKVMSDNFYKEPTLK